MLCKNCGAEVGQGKFCPNCGMEVTPPVSYPNPVYCTHCGSEIGQAKFCPNCGAAARPAQSYPAVQSQIPAYNPAGQTNPIESFNLFTAYRSMFKKYADETMEFIKKIEADGPRLPGSDEEKLACKNIQQEIWMKMH